MTGIRQQDFRHLDRARDPQAGLRYLDAVAAVAAVKEYKEQTFEMLEVGPGHSVLDVGCGTGDDARALAARVEPGGRVVGVDMSEAAIAEAIKRSAGLTARVEFRRCDALELEFPSDEFDGARADRVLLHVEDPGRALSELIRVTRPGGKVVVFDGDWDALVIDSPDRETTREIVRSNSDALRNGWIGRQFRGMFLSAGLAQVEVRPVAAVLTSFTVADELFYLTTSAEAAVESKRITAAQATQWLDQLRAADQAGAFFSSITGFIVAGRKPAAG